MADWERAKVREDAEGQWWCTLVDGPDAEGGRGVKRWCLKCGGSATGELYDTTCAHEMAPRLDGEGQTWRRVGAAS